MSDLNLDKKLLIELIEQAVSKIIDEKLDKMALSLRCLTDEQ